MSNIIVTGGASGLGLAIVSVLSAAGHKVLVFDKTYGDDVLSPPDFSEAEIDVLINCAGINGIDFLEDLSEELWDSVMDTNAKGIYKMSKSCLPALIRSKGTILNIVSNAAHMPMTSSLAYNASKGAALIMTKQMARELTRRHDITVFSISPNRLAGTKMSDQIDLEVVRTRGWTLDYAREYQRQGLLAGEETDPKQLAEFVAFLLQDKDHHKYLTGCDLQYGL